MDPEVFPRMHAAMRRMNVNHRDLLVRLLGLHTFGVKLDGFIRRFWLRRVFDFAHGFAVTPGSGRKNVSGCSAFAFPNAAVTCCLNLSACSENPPSSRAPFIASKPSTLPFGKCRRVKYRASNPEYSPSCSSVICDRFGLQGSVPSLNLHSKAFTSSPPLCAASDICCSKSTCRYR